MKSLRRFVAVLLALTFAAGLFACNPDVGKSGTGSTAQPESSGDGTGGSEAPPKEKITLGFVVNGESEYKLVYPKITSDSVKNLANKLHEAIEKYSGATLTLCDDSEAVSEHEILIGETNRVESQAVMSDMRFNDYKIEVFDGKIAIAGGNDESQQKAYQRFLDKIIYTQGNSGAEKGSFTISTDDDYYFAYNYKLRKDLAVNGVPLREYKLIYENGSVYAEYCALLLREQLKERYGYALSVYADNELQTEKEILIGMTSRTEGTLEKDSFTVKMQNGRLCVMFDGMVSQECALDYLTGTVLTQSVTADYEKTVALSELLTGSAQSVFGNKGELRLMVNNIYQALDSYEERMVQLQMVYSVYKPDVLGLQEAGYTSWIKSEDKSIHALMQQLGYETVLGGGGKTNATPIVYNKATLELLDSGYFIYTLENNGNSKSYTWGHFKMKSTGKTFLFFSTHFMYNTGISQDGKTTYDEIRINNARELSAKVKELYAEYNCPVFGGGDINSLLYAPPYNELINQGFKNCRFIAQISTSPVGTCVETYTIDRETGFFLNPPEEKEISSGEIDTILAYGEGYEVLLHYVLRNDFALTASDHIPVLVDVNLK